MVAAHVRSALATAGGDQAAALAAARSHVQGVVAASGTSFYWSMRLLPRAQRLAMYAVYAYCREIDDLADGDQPATVKLAALAAWRSEVEALFAGRPTRPTTIALAGPVGWFDLPRAELDLLLDGMEMDARGETVVPSAAGLEHYCRCVAGAVGMLSVRVFGLGGEAIDQGAVALGEALQLTNILRDLREDAALGRVYLPRELLAEHGVQGEGPGAMLAHPGLTGVCVALAERAEARFVEAERRFAGSDRRRLRPVLIMMHIYWRTLGRLRARGWRALDRPVRLGRLERLWLALRHGLL